jgi:hypothetical protein
MGGGKSVASCSVDTHGVCKTVWSKCRVKGVKTHG